MKKYSKDLSYSYVFGAFGTIELLKHKAEECIKVLIDPSFVKNDAYKLIKQICESHSIEIEINNKTLNKIKDKGNIYVVGVFNKYSSTLSNKKHLILTDVNDVGCIGTIIRSMIGFDYHDLVLINCDVDIYNEHLIRSTMGAFFKVNIKQYNNILDYLNDYKDNKIINICHTGKEIKEMPKENDLSIMFSNNPIKNINNYQIKKDISLDNIVNIVLFTLYNN